jgi:phage gp29-like protein
MNNTNTTLKGFGGTLGKTGTLVFGGIITSEEYNLNLTGKLAIRIFDEMSRSDGTVHQALEMVKLPIMGVNWNVEPASDDAIDIEAAGLIKQELFERKLNWNSVIDNACDMLDFGYSVLEKTYELIDYEGKTRIGISELGYRKQTSIYSWQTKEKTPGITQQLIGDQISIPMAKLIVFTNKKKGDNYEGISLLRYCYRDWYMKKTLIKVNGINIERLGAGVPVIEFEDNVSETEKARARNILRQLRANEESYLEKPKGSNLEMLDMKSATTKDALPTIQYHDTEIAGSVLSSFMKLGNSQHGSRAVGDVQYKPYVLQEEALAQNIQATIQEQLIKQLCDLNYTDLPNGYPKLQHGKLQDDDIAVLSAAVNSLVTAGALTPNAETEQYIRRSMHLPELSEEEEKNWQPPKQQPDPSLNPDPTAKNKATPADPKAKKDVKADAIANAKVAENQLLDVLLG